MDAASDFVSLPVASAYMHRPQIRSSDNDGSMGIADADYEDDADLIDEDEDEERGEPADEVNAIATGNIRGFTAPLGTGGRSGKKPHWQTTADSFGRAKKVKI